MHRIAAALAFVALSQSAVLQTGVLCNGLDVPSARSAAMADMGMDGAPATGAPVQPGHDRRHGGAHCQLMATCGAAVVASVQVVAREVSPVSCVIHPARTEVPRSDRTAPEPPPPKR